MNKKDRMKGRALQRDSLVTDTYQVSKFVECHSKLAVLLVVSRH